MKFSLLSVFLLPIVLGGCSSCSSSSNPPATTFNLPPGPLTAEGVVTTDIGGFDDSANAIRVQEDGKIVVAGNTFNGTDNDIALLRYLENGQLDPSFGENGIVTIDISNTDDHASDLLIQEDGNIIVVGNTVDGSDKDILLLRILPNGMPDLSFGMDGRVVTDISGENDEAGSVIIVPDGKLIVGGMAQYPSTCNALISTYDFVLLRYWNDGSLDTTFGTDGIVLTDFNCDQDYGGRVALQVDGKILLGGSIYVSPAQDYSIARYLSDGTLDSSFGEDGKVITNLGDGYDFTRGILLQENGNGTIILSGTLFDETIGGYNFGILRYLSNGNLDLSFGTDGIQTIDYFNGIDVSDGIVELPNGNLVLAGWTETTSNRDFAIAMLDPNGILKADFGNDGKAIRDFGYGDDLGHAICLGKNGAILVAGGAYNGANIDFGIAQFSTTEE